MNKYQEALHKLVKHIDFPQSQQRKFDSKKDEPRKYYIALQELVDKVTPKKVNCYTFDKHTGTCPRCGITVYHFMNVYCQHCGQKLDWSKNNE